MKPKTYKINTLDDIYNCVTPENVDRFLIDFSAILVGYVSMVENVRVVQPEKCVGLKNTEIIIRGENTWIDDGEHNIEFKFTTK